MKNNIFIAVKRLGLSLISFFLVFASPEGFATKQSFLETHFLKWGDYPIIKALQDSYRDERRYDEVSWLTAHNAFSNKQEGWQGYYQQYLNLTNQFLFGVRSFMLDLHWFNPRDPEKIRYLALCHEDNSVVERSGSTFGGCPITHAFFGNPRSFEDALEEIGSMLTLDAEAIITLHLESYAGYKGPEELGKLFRKTRVDRFLFKPKRQADEWPIMERLYRRTQKEPSLLSDWPILGQMRRLNQRLVVFSDNKDDSQLEGVFYVDSYRETQYSLAASPHCKMREDKRDITKKKSLFVFNHFYQMSVGTEEPFIQANSLSKILKRLHICYQEQGRMPNFIAVDFVDLGIYPKGGAREVVVALNQLTPAQFRGEEEPVSLVPLKEEL